MLNWHTHLQLAASRSNPQGKCGLMPGSAVNGGRPYNSANPHPLTILLTVRQFGKLKRAHLGQTSLPDHSRLTLSNDRSKLPRTRDALNFDDLAQHMRRGPGHVSFDVNASGCVLDQKVRRRSVHRDHTANTH